MKVISLLDVFAKIDKIPAPKAKVAIKVKTANVIVVSARKCARPSHDVGLYILKPHA